MNFYHILPLFIIASILIGTVIGHSGGGSALRGALVGFLIGWSPLVLLALAAGFFALWSPDRPLCKQGKCKSLDYKFLRLEKPDKDQPPTAYFYRCPCGVDYVQRDGDFLELFEGKLEKPFMKLSKWGRWKRVE